MKEKKKVLFTATVDSHIMHFHLPFLKLFKEKGYEPDIDIPIKITGLRPGLTGWAQVNVRDELEIKEKAKFDGEYTKNISFIFDTKIFFMTILKVFKRDGVVESGTGKINKIDIKKQWGDNNE